MTGSARERVGVARDSPGTYLPGTPSAWSRSPASAGAQPRRRPPRAAICATGKESTMGKRILITGGAGFIGSHLCDEMIEHGCEVRVLDALAPQVHGPRA